MGQVDQRKVQLAVRQELLDRTDELPDRELFSWQNRNFNPPNPPELWIRERFLPNLDRVASVGGGLNLALGLTIYDVFTPAGTGTKESQEMTKRIADTFEPKTIEREGIKVYIDRASRGSGSLWTKDESWYVAPVEIEWRAYALATDGTSP